MTIILGSTSPRRREILDYFSLSFEVIPSHFDESKVAYDNDPESYVKALAVCKAQVLEKQYADAIILTADTAVCIDNKILGKPNNEAEMRDMLTNLSGRWHSVWTAVSASYKDAQFCMAEETKVLCNSLKPDEMHRYMKQLALHDKAGGYAIQKSGALFVKEISGCYYNVMGLPINALQKVLQHVGIDLWDYLQELE